MSGLGDYIWAIKTVWRRKKLKKEKKCRIDARSKVNFKTCGFEGDNSVGKFTILNYCRLGYGSYISENSLLERASIGKFCAIGPNVHIVTGRHPTCKFASIHPAFYSLNRNIGPVYVKKQKFQEHIYADKGSHNFFVNIGNDVWIGDSAIIMEGVDIADGTIVAAGAVVVNSTEPYSIVGGNPAKLIRYRFEADDIDFLLHLKWWNYEEEWIQQYAEFFEDIHALRLALERNKEDKNDNRRV